MAVTLEPVLPQKQASSAGARTAISVKEGWLLKRGNRSFIRTWKRRFFSLELPNASNATAVVRYFKSETLREAPQKSLTGGTIDLSLSIPDSRAIDDEGIVADLTRNAFEFHICCRSRPPTVSARVWQLRAQSSTEADEWVRLLRVHAGFAKTKHENGLCDSLVVVDSQSEQDSNSDWT